jgi:hypothetical protein
MDQGLMDLYKRKVITGEEAYMKAFNKKLFEPLRESGQPPEEEEAVEEESAAG